MKFRTALSALTAVAIVSAAPALALAQTPAAQGGKVVSSTPVPNPPEKSSTKTTTSKTTTSKATTTHKAKHHSSKSHRRHKAEVSKTTGATPAANGAEATPTGGAK
jgi:hypothetical protein